MSSKFEYTNLVHGTVSGTDFVLNIQESEQCEYDHFWGML